MMPVSHFVKPAQAGELEIDLYHGDAEIDFAALKAEGRVKRIYMKVSESHVDPTFAVRTRKAQEHGFPVGGYHFMRADIGGMIQGKLFRDAIRYSGIKFDLAPCLDWEEGSALGRSVEHQRNVADLFLNLVEDEFSRECEIYGGQAFLKSLELPPSYNHHSLWLAHYGTTFEKLHIPAPWSIDTLAGWQYTDAETVAGLPPGRHVDASWTYKAQT